MKTKSINLLIIVILGGLCSCQSKIESFKEINRLPVIFPDYTGILIPPNIAPLNFYIKETGIEFEARFYVKHNDPIVIRSKTPDIRIDFDSWRKLLNKNTGSRLNIDIFVKNKNDNWSKFKTIANDISTDEIDTHLVYRLINTGYVLYKNMGIYQRNLENFNQKPIVENNSIDNKNCVNCHSFSNNNPEKMMIHIRGPKGGTIIYQHGNLKKINTKTNFTLNAGVYPSWHPDGRHIAYSVNTINQYFYNGKIRIEVSDKFSDLVVYDTEKNTITTSPKVSTASRENLPVWSPDGKYIYYISAAPTTDLENRNYAKYDLLRIAFDVKTNVWGDADTIISSKKAGKSISFPKISPDGKFLIFCMSEYGYFTIHHPMSDIYLLNLATGVFNKMEINSSQTDSYHSFSSTGRWLVFSSKRLDGLFTRPFICHFYENGKATKPFVLPQENPHFYDTFLKNYNIPELTTNEVTVSPLAIRDIVLKDATPVKFVQLADTLYLKKHIVSIDKK